MAAQHGLLDLSKVSSTHAKRTVTNSGNMYKVYMFCRQGPILGAKVMKITLAIVASEVTMPKKGVDYFLAKALTMLIMQALYYM